MFDITNYQSINDTVTVLSGNNKNQEVQNRLNLIKDLYELVSSNRPMINKEGKSLMDMLPKVNERTKSAFDKKLTAWKQLVVGVNDLYRMYIVEVKNKEQE